MLEAVPEMPIDERALDVRDLRMRYGSTDVLRGVTFAARRGEVLALLGPNGAGKTTMVLGVWAIAGTAAAPVLLRRMARRESGSAVAQRRERAMQRTT